MAKIDIDFARPIFGDEEKAAVGRVLDQHWLASGVENEAFEREFAAYIGATYAVCVNSGSSANLLALAALDLPPGSKVLTSGCGFPATLSPILHLGLEPVLVDYALPEHNIDIYQTLSVMQAQDIRAIIFAHTMGVPVGMASILREAKRRNIAVIGDCCEALGAIYAGTQVGALEDLGTYSFYPSHQITALGGGGMVVTSDEKLFRRLRSLRDWGKASDWDRYGRNNTKYDRMVDGIPYFPHYVYETVGYNMKLPEANAAFGREQLKRLPAFVEQRASRHALLDNLVNKDRLIQHRVPVLARPSWFGYVLSLEDSDGGREKLGDYLEAHGVRHRPFFAGNITRHPPFTKYRQEFPVADFLMRHSIFVGCWPGLTDTDIEYMANTINAGLNQAWK